VSPRDYFAGTHQALAHDTINPAQQAIYEPNASLYDVRVEVEKIEEAWTGEEEVRADCRSGEQNLTCHFIKIRSGQGAGYIVLSMHWQ